MKYYVTTGISVSQSARCWRDRRKEADGCTTAEEILKQFPAEAPEILEDLQSRTEEVFAKIHGDPARGPQAFLESARSAADQFDTNCWDVGLRHLLPAELATLFAMHRDNGLLTPADQIVFLSGMPDGDFPGNQKESALLCAMMEMILQEHSDLTGLAVELHPQSANWNPTDARSFRNNMAKLCDELEESACFVLTGGYKGVLIYLSHYLTKRKATGQLYYLHEDSDKLVDFPLDLFFGEDHRGHSAG